MTLKSFFGDMSHGDAMRLTLCPFLSIIPCKDRLMVNERKTAVHQRISKLRRPMFDHVASVFRLAGLVIPRLQTGEREHFGRAVKFAKVAKFGKDDGGRKFANTRQREWAGQYLARIL